MPNNPGRIDGDYSIGEAEEVKFVDPGNFGTVKDSVQTRRRTYAIMAGLALVCIVAIAILLWKP